MSERMTDEEFEAAETFRVSFRGEYGEPVSEVGIDRWSALVDEARRARAEEERLRAELRKAEGLGKLGQLAVEAANAVADMHDVLKDLKNELDALRADLLRERQRADEAEKKLFDLEGAVCDQGLSIVRDHGRVTVSPHGLLREKYELRARAEDAEKKLALIWNADHEMEKVLARVEKYRKALEWAADALERLMPHTPAEMFDAVDGTLAMVRAALTQEPATTESLACCGDTGDGYYEPCPKPRGHDGFHAEPSSARPHSEPATTEKP